MFVRDASVDFCTHRHFSTHWIRSVAHICHHWREVALTCPTLWSTPIFTNPELAQEMMRRSKMAALTIQLTTGSWTPGTLLAVEIAMTQIFRIRVLRLSYGSQFDGLRNIFAAFSQPAPHLEQLALTNSAYLAHGSHFLLPDNAFAHAPRLRSIELDRFNFSWTSALFKHNVTTLKVKTSRPQDTATLSQLLEALSHMPNLCTLRLNQCIPSHVTADGNEPVLNFPALRSLEIDSKIADCIHFLRCIKYHPRATLSLTCTSLTKASDYTDIFARIGEGLRQPSSDSQVFRSAQFTLNHDRTMSIYLFRRVDTLVRPSYIQVGPPADPGICLRFTSNETPGLSYYSVLRELHRLIDLQSLETIALDWVSYRQDIDHIRETIGKLPKLKTLRVGVASIQACHAIHYNPDTVPTEREQGRTRRQKQQYKPPPVTVFPALKTLCLHSLDLNEYRSMGTFETLKNALIHRSNMDAPIEQLQLDQCRGVGVEQKRLLGELVVDLMVDGEHINVLELNSDDEEDSYDEEDEMDEEDMYEHDLYYEGMYGYDFEFDYDEYPF
ncbi:hypothetical protein AGABI2DRAFT_178872 [Agaricus bisporus var. bisporus H97]|uniref:hypothetical protein n=1 Tax=Agaricus bisporus var. bisporus (strain H97 / ATCC MYA-4626 / FGSC 10389) TaxID=936046 RepID=UPI00029F5577|nr:hypothetical protein AGABI2DRAFT_178872 [Agaricus bisporus var. bisporus H97]EKV46572.1 hypothetical protein AGABI2DRAFT_178872 [Agaricus bisporus var. bisporus H97]